MNAPRAQRTRPATSAVNLVTSLATAPTLLKRVLDVAVEDSHPEVVEDLKSATSALRLVTLPVTARRLVDTAAAVVVSAASKDTVAVDMEVVVVVVDKPATLAVVMDTCLVTVPKAKSATTAVRLVTCPETAHPRQPASALATSASNLATFRLNARTKPRMLQSIH